MHTTKKVITTPNDPPLEMLERIPVEIAKSGIEDAKKKVFSQICEAAKKRDVDQLASIKNNYLHDDEGYERYEVHPSETCFSIIINGFTPLTFLAHAGDIESAKFLYKQFPASSFLIREWELVQDPNRFLDYAVHDNYWDIRDVLNIHKTEILLPYLDKLPDGESLNLAYFRTCADIFKGNSTTVAGFLNNLLDDEILFEHSAKNSIAFLAGKYAPINVPKGILSEQYLKRLFLQGSVVGGHYTQTVDSLFLPGKTPPFKKVPFVTAIKIAYFLVTELLYMNLLPTIYHPDILQSMMACNDPYGFYRALLNRKVNNEHTEKLVCKRLESKSLLLKQCMLKFHINYEQALFLTRPEVLTWLMQGVQLVTQQYVLVPELLIKIMSLIQPGISDDLATDLFNKVFFVINRDFMINDIDRYLSGIYNANRHHAKRANSVKEACLHVNNASHLKSIINDQLCLFAGSLNGNKESKLKHEKPFGKKGRDEFIDILEKHQKRML